MQPAYNIIITTHLLMICDFFLNAGHLFKIYKDLYSFNYWLHKIYSYMCYQDRHKKLWWEII